jgi:hypothetical protein
MRREKAPERKSARLEKRRRVPTPSLSPRREKLFTESEIEDSVAVTPPGKTSSTPRSRSPEQNPDLEEETMTRLKYKRFKGDGNQDVDN